LRSDNRRRDPVDAARLALRLTALGSVLDDLPGQARRFARWRAARDAVGAQDRNRDAAGAQNKTGAATPQARKTGAATPQARKTGTATHRSRRTGKAATEPAVCGRCAPAARPVHEVLRDLQWFAVKALERTDTS
jgi:hypothetical protein